MAFDFTPRAGRTGLVTKSEAEQTRVGPTSNGSAYLYIPNHLFRPGLEPGGNAGVWCGVDDDEGWIAITPYGDRKVASNAGREKSARIYVGPNIMESFVVPQRVVVVAHRSDESGVVFDLRPFLKSNIRPTGIFRFFPRGRDPEPADATANA